MLNHISNSLQFISRSSGVEARDARNTAAFPSKNIWAKLIRFGKNQNLASPNTFNLIYLCQRP